MAVATYLDVEPESASGPVGTKVVKIYTLSEDDETLSNIYDYQDVQENGSFYPEKGELVKRLFDAEKRLALRIYETVGIVLTAAEVMVSITCLEFAYTQAPNAIKSIVMSKAPREVRRPLFWDRSLVRQVADRPGHDRRYSIDASKIRELVRQVYARRAEPDARIRGGEQHLRARVVPYHFANLLCGANKITAVGAGSRILAESPSPRVHHRFSIARLASA